MVSGGYTQQSLLKKLRLQKSRAVAGTSHDAAVILIQHSEEKYGRSIQEACWRKLYRMSDLRSRGPEFDSRLGRYQVVTTWMGDCPRTGKPPRYVTDTDINSAFHPSAVGKSSTGLSSCG